MVLENLSTQMHAIQPANIYEVLLYVRDRYACPESAKSGKKKKNRQVHVMYDVGCTSMV